MMSKSTFKCDKCGYCWSTTGSSVVTSGVGCGRCSGKAPLTRDEILQRIEGRGISLISYSGRMNVKSVFQCDTCKTQWETPTRHVVSGSGCPTCNVLSLDSINIRIKDRNISIIDYAGGSLLKSTFKCGICNHKWLSRANTVLSGCGCPRCANHGYKSSKRGTIYAFRSTDGKWLKVGITNNLSKRQVQLKKATPFSIELVLSKTLEDGLKIRECEIQIHRQFDSAPVKLIYGEFNGHTEWLMFDEKILKIISDLH
nr:MAG TPA: endonuclease [Caudoviricetes sp.]